ncbi:MAG: GNAT family protein [Thermomicrobiales bacterium]
MSESVVWAQYLMDDEIRMRPPEESDAELASRWQEQQLPMTAERALASLKETETVPWGDASLIRLIAGTRADGDIVGGVRIDRHDHWVEALAITPSRDLTLEKQQDIAVRMLQIVVPWLVQEVGVSSILMRIPADHEHLTGSAGQLGFQRGATFRQHVFRATGFVDLHLYQLLNPE